MVAVSTPEMSVSFYTMDQSMLFSYISSLWVEGKIFCVNQRHYQQKNWSTVSYRQLPLGSNFYSMGCTCFLICCPCQPLWTPCLSLLMDMECIDSSQWLYHVLLLVLCIIICIHYVRTILHWVRVKCCWHVFHCKTSCVTLSVCSSGTLIQGAVLDRRTAVGLILGTGSNACYMERADRVQHWEGQRHGEKQVSFVAVPL
jgi:hypothetical protein